MLVNNGAAMVRHSTCRADFCAIEGYAAGCVTPANCQMIIAAGHGAVATQAINRDLFEESLRTPLSAFSGCD